MHKKAIVTLFVLLLSGFFQAVSAGHPGATIRDKQTYQDTLISPRLIALQKEVETDTVVNLSENCAFGRCDLMHRRLPT
jgi:hypothetical protein